MIRRLLPVLIVLASSQCFADVPTYYQRVSAAQNIPAVILYAIAMQESRPPEGLIEGVNEPWPWTLNCKGQGYFFPSRNAAFITARQFIDSGLSCDIGLMQVSWVWHKQRFISLDEALDPYTNIRIGAVILKEQYAKSRSWEHAVGAYHNPSDPIKAGQYRERVRARLANIMGVTF